MAAGSKLPNNFKIRADPSAKTSLLILVSSHNHSIANKWLPISLFILPFSLMTDLTFSLKIAMAVSFFGPSVNSMASATCQRQVLVYSKIKKVNPISSSCSTKKAASITTSITSKKKTTKHMRPLRLCRDDYYEGNNGGGGSADGDWSGEHQHQHRHHHRHNKTTKSVCTAATPIAITSSAPPVITTQSSNSNNNQSLNQGDVIICSHFLYKFIYVSNESLDANNKCRFHIFI